MFMHGHDRPGTSTLAVRSRVVPTRGPAPVLRTSHSPKQLELPFFSRPMPLPRDSVVGGLDHEPVPDTV